MYGKYNSTGFFCGESGMKGHFYMKQFALDMKKYQKLARQAAADGCVLLENENQALPLKENERIAVYGRIAFTYYKSTF